MPSESALGPRAVNAQPNEVPWKWRLVRRLVKLPRFRGLRRLFWLTRKWLRPLPLTVMITLDDDITLPVDLDNEIGAQLFIYGFYEPEVTQIFTAVVQAGDTVVDAGANIGYYSLLAAKYAGPKGHIVAFEPCPPTFAQLQRNIEEAGYQNIKTLPLALSDVEGEAELSLVRDVAPGRATLATPRDTVAHTWRVKTVRLDDCVERGICDIPNVLKADLEGAEGHLFRGAHGVLSSARPPVLFFEVCESAWENLGNSVAEVLEQLRSEYGYKLFCLTRYGPEPLTDAPPHSRVDVLGVVEEVHNSRLERCLGENAKRDLRNYWTPIFWEQVKDLEGEQCCV